MIFQEPTLLADLTVAETSRPALGNVLVQARALGADLPDLAAMCALVRRTHDLRRHEPRTGLDWNSTQTRLEAGVNS